MRISTDHRAVLSIDGQGCSLAAQAEAQTSAAVTPMGIIFGDLLIIPKMPDTHIYIYIYDIYIIYIIYVHISMNTIYI